MHKRVLAMVLAGGKGTRLSPLTEVRSKPSVPFGGIYRIIDFVLSNLANSDIKSIYVLTQFKSQSLTEHLLSAWSGTRLRPGNFILPVPAQMQTGGEVWYRGTADAIAQNANLIHDTQPDLVCIFGGDHIYIMDVRPMLREHLRNESDVTIAAIPVPQEEGSRFGVLEVDAGGRVIAFHEKVANPPTIPGDPERCYASMGNYVFSSKVLEDVLVADQLDPNSTKDFGHDILPNMVRAGQRVFAYDFQHNHVPGWDEGTLNTYWRDVGTLESYFEANLDLKDVTPQLNVFNPDWRIHAAGSTAAPAKFVHDSEGRVGSARMSVIGPGSIISGAGVKDSVLGRRVNVHSYASIEEAVVMDDVELKRGCHVRRAILDKNVVIEEGERVGFDADEDRKKGYHVTETGITVVPKRAKVRAISLIDL
ncbi:MAG: glucose-1-phosphate adenylyltransferase [Planctomycetota bacterium]|jgi:glucose-1-phosphate adenylyltransferase